MKILSIETSCDETAVAVTEGRVVLSSVINSQTEIHKKYGGVVPEIASREHTLAIDAVTRTALKEAGLDFKDISAIAVTYGAGLLGALLVGVSYAKGLAYALNIPLYAVNHLKGHISANYIANKDLKPPFITLLASGGHTQILKVNALNDIEILGETVDDSAGEAFDKVARVLGLPYPGGPEIEKLAKFGSPDYVLPRAFKNENHLNFSFSGIKTAVINLVTKIERGGGVVNKANLASSFQSEVCEILTKNTVQGAKNSNISTVTLAGGVGANGYLRDLLSAECKKAGLTLLLPPKHLCTDNGAMIGVCAHEEIQIGAKPADLSLDANPSARV
ncbi:MAG: tRNA (adenosine(37)-N6)-threonylcarbamoyltransferase complex transferase subunit TsaD [Firmicutes bacterium]|nr:tRNA (adenosine(37)-N6)-threonylcarbamoyltransferase complex transferase subunit TsaD [Bacillota bacterium]